MELNETYKWQVELDDSTVINRDDYVKDKSLCKNLNYDSITKVSLVPQVEVLPEHTIFIDKQKGEKFIKGFGRGFKKNRGMGFKLENYVHCIVTNKYKFWVFCRGSSLVTNTDYEVYI